MINRKSVGGSSGRNPFYQGLPKVNAGSPISASTINNLSGAIDKFALKSTKDYRVERNNGGTVLRINQSSGGYKPIIPFQCSLISVDGNWSVSANVGTVNGIIPKMGNRYLDDTIDGFPSLDFNTDCYVCLRVARSDSSFFPKSVDIVLIAGKDDMSVIQDTEDYGYKCIATIRKVLIGDAEVYNVTNLVFGNFIVNRIKIGNGSAMYTWGYE